MPIRAALRAKAMPRLADPNVVRRQLEQAPRILIIRLRSLGDSILILPLLQALNEWRPDLHLDVLVETPFVPVFANHPAVHELLKVRPKGSHGAGWNRASAILHLRSRRYPLVVNLHGGTTSALFTAASGAGLRVGQAGYRSAWVYNALIPRSSELWHSDTLHTVQHQLSLMRWLDLPVPSRPRGDLHLEAGAAGRIRQRLRLEGITDYLLIQPTATLATKQWQPENYGWLADALSLRHSLQVVFTAAAAEEQVLLDVARAARLRHHYWTDLGLPELFAAIAGARLFIGNDSGPTHAAAALGRPVVVVWGSSNYNAWHPWNTEFEAIRSDLPCMPCPGYTCSAYGFPRCIREITLERVLEACNRMIGRSRPADGSCL